MPAARWTTAEELKFLQSYKGAYRDAQNNGAAAQTMFWASFYEKWFLHFSIDTEDERRQQARREPENACTNSEDGQPEVSEVALTPPLTGDTGPIDRQARIHHKRGQLKTWFRNNTRLDARPKSTTFMETLSKKLVQDAAPRTRARRPIEIFSKDEYARSGTKAIVDKRMIDEKPALIGPETKQQWKKRWITIYNKELGLAWAGAAPEVRKAAEEKALRLAREEKEAAEAEKAKAKESRGAEGVDSKLSPTEVQEFINQLPSLLPAFLNQLRRKTGWVFTVLAGGPMPVAGGQIEIASVHIGETELGNTWSEAYGGYERDIVKPFTDFVRLVCDPQNAHAFNANGADWSLGREGLVVPLAAPVPITPVPTTPVTLPGVAPTSGTAGSSLATSVTLNAPSEVTSGLISFDDLPIFSPEVIAAHASGTIPADLGYDEYDLNFGDPFNFAGFVAGGTGAQGHDYNVGTQLTPPPEPTPPSELTLPAGPTPTPPPEPTPPSELTLPAGPTPTPPPEPTPPSELTLPAGPTPTPPPEPTPPSELTLPAGPTPTPPPEPTPPSELTLPAGPAPTQPAWMQKAVTYMRSLPLGEAWTTLVTTWITLEGKLGFGLVEGKKMKLPTDLRPPQVADWMQRARPLGTRPLVESVMTIKDVKVFSEDVMKWWKRIQPAWRQGDGKLPLPIYTPAPGENWDVLSQGGTNGLLLVMLVLGWWGDTEPSQAWQSVVADATKAFNSAANLYITQSTPTATTQRKRRQEDSAKDVMGTERPKRTRVTKASNTTSSRASTARN
ncbi:hypothetical protein EYR40_008379 [Pleurotus pulmonarius]|nr:hypothetical protein EYR40_008379 [Pleurotus pulmonarius]